jgi:hypothetical protein
MPCDYKKYPSDWKTVRVPRILKRAENRCERCGIHHHAVGYRDTDGEFMPNAGNLHCDASGTGQHPSGERLSYAEAREFAEQYNCCGTKARPEDDEGNHWFVVVLTVAHLDRAGAPGTPEGDGPLDCPDDRLQALCQRCHLMLDAPRHAVKRRVSRMAKLAVGPLFETVEAST